jgi:hypothetical protein
MGNYLVMKRHFPKPDTVQGYVEIEESDTEGFGGWRTGKPARSRPEGAVVINVVMHDGFTGEPHDFQDNNVPLMSARLKEAIESVGIDNINFFPVTLRNPATERTYEYFAFNLIGLVAAADLAKSQIASHDGDFMGDSQIHNLVLDESKAHGLLMFRLKEKYSTLLVHHKVRDAILSRQIDTVQFIEPEDYMAL